MGVTEWTIVVLVIGARLALPLLIPYFPVPALLACLILDAIDQSIFQQFPAIPLDGYQSYDKALDVYYLSVAYLSTLRNWTNQGAFRMAQFLYYYRMIGVVAFELTQNRTILFIFPNTFEYFFLFVELVRLGWNTERMGKWTVILSAAGIWIFIKLPQEWWIHIAQLDMTDFIKETLFGVAATDSWSTAIANRPWVLVAAIAIIAILAAIVYWIITRKAPKFDHGPHIAADPLPPLLRGAEPYRKVRAETRIFGWALREKVALTAIVCVDLRPHAHRRRGEHRCASSSAWRSSRSINAAVSHVMAIRGRSWRRLAGELVTMLIVNLVIVLVLEALDRWLGVRSARAPFGMTLFFAYLLTLIIVLYDRFRTVYKARRLYRRRGEGGAGCGRSGAGGGAGLSRRPAPAWISSSTTSSTSTST